MERGEIEERVKTRCPRGELDAAELGSTGLGSAWSAEREMDVGGIRGPVGSVGRRTTANVSGAPERPYQESCDAADAGAVRPDLEPWSDIDRRVHAAGAWARGRGAKCGARMRERELDSPMSRSA